MIVRVVRMTFREEEREGFFKIFDESKNSIRNYDGCLLLELWQDIDNPNIFTSHSHWLSTEKLEAYRQSALFKKVWGLTKPLFAAKPLAFSCRAITKAI